MTPQGHRFVLRDADKTYSESWETLDEAFDEAYPISEGQELADEQTGRVYTTDDNDSLFEEMWNKWLANGELDGPWIVPSPPPWARDRQSRDQAGS
jgi:hypothetical protein